MTQPGEPGLNARARAEATQRRRILQLSRRLSATLGGDFFRSLVKNLSEALTLDYVCVGEVSGTSQDRVKCLAGIVDGRPASAFEHRLAGSACGQVMLDGVFACSKDVQRIFPDDTHLKESGLEGYAGIRLSDFAGQPLGALVMANKAPLPDANLAKSVLETFAPRVAAEIRRRLAGHEPRADASLPRLRDLRPQASAEDGRDALTARRSETRTISWLSAVTAPCSNTTQPVCGLTGPPTSTEEFECGASPVARPRRSSIERSCTWAGRFTTNPIEPSGL